MHLLSPQQGLILMEAMRMTAQKLFHEVVDVAILPAWISVCDKRHPRQLEESSQLQVSDEDDSDGEECRCLYHTD